MKGLKKIALVSTIAAVSAGAQAELKALDDAMMGELTGQAGLTIDIETEWSIGEFAYQDAGLVILKDMSMGGKGNRASKAAGTGPVLMDNIRLSLDVAGKGATPGDNVSNYGMSKVKGLAAIHASKGADLATFGAAAAGAGNPAGASLDPNDTSMQIDNERVNGDGDLTLHFGFNDAWQAAGGFKAFNEGNGVVDGASKTYATLTWDEAIEVVSQAVDFEFGIGQIALADSDYATDGRLGSAVINGGQDFDGIDDDSTGTQQTTTLISDLKMSGYLGPMDIRIQNRGNGFGTYDENGVYTASAEGKGEAASKIEWDSFFKVTDLDLYIDIAGVQLSDISIHNSRGDKSSLNTNYTFDASGNVTGTVATTAFGFAHSKREIFAVKDSVLNPTAYLRSALNNGGAFDEDAMYVDGIAINTRFKGDIDIGAISFGDTGTSIGKIFMTDVESTTNWTISAH